MCAHFLVTFHPHFRKHACAFATTFPGSAKIHRKSCVRFACIPNKSDDTCVYVRVERLNAFMMIQFGPCPTLRAQVSTASAPQRPTPRTAPQAVTTWQRCVSTPGREVLKVLRGLLSGAHTILHFLRQASLLHRTAPSHSGFLLMHALYITKLLRFALPFPQLPTK